MKIDYAIFQNIKSHMHMSTHVLQKKKNLIINWKFNMFP